MDTKDNNLKFATRAIHAGFDPKQEQHGAVMPAIYQSTTFAQTSPGTPLGNYEYSRSANPTRTVLESILADLEQGTHGFCFSSGCAALSTLLHCIEPNSHVILSDDVYGGTVRIFKQVFAKFAITHSICDLSNIDNLKQAYQDNTQLIWLETPSNPLLKIIDIAKICAINSSQARPALVAVDNTFATPYLQQPLQLGADIVCHSTTKYIGGHSDAVGGALVVKNTSIAEKIAFMQNAIGAISGPQDCYLLIRSLKTLSLRMQRHCENALQVANFLQDHHKIEQVFYPGLNSHPQHSIATQQMSDYGGMISVMLKGNLKDAQQFLSKLQIFTLAESLGGVESLIEHPAIMTHATLTPEHRQQLGITDGFIRLSIGIEDVSDLISDLDAALQ